MPKPHKPKQPKPRKADTFAKGTTSTAARLKARRQAIESGDLAGAQKAYTRGYYKRGGK